jgi:hypothetical protein
MSFVVVLSSLLFGEAAFTVCAHVVPAEGATAHGAQGLAAFPTLVVVVESQCLHAVSNCLNNFHGLGDCEGD